METKIYNQRLVKFAKHLAKQKTHPEMGEYSYAILCDLTGEKEVQFGVCFHAWIFNDLPLLFPEQWYFNDHLKEPFLMGLDAEEGSIAGIFDFFGLNPHEFAHLFDLDGSQQPHLFGGNFLIEDSTGEDISNNIFQLILHKNNRTHFEEN